MTPTLVGIGAAAALGSAEQNSSDWDCGVGSAAGLTYGTELRPSVRPSIHPSIPVRITAHPGSALLGDGKCPSVRPMGMGRASVGVWGFPWGGPHPGQWLRVTVGHNGGVRWERPPGAFVPTELPGRVFFPAFLWAFFFFFNYYFFIIIIFYFFYRFVLLSVVIPFSYFLSLFYLVGAAPLKPRPPAAQRISAPLHHKALPGWGGGGEGET